MIQIHWGTTPGLNFIYAHLNRLIRARDLDIIYMCRTGRGRPHDAKTMKIARRWSARFLCRLGGRVAATARRRRPASRRLSAESSIRKVRLWSEQQASSMRSEWDRSSSASATWRRQRLR
ncbi:hypothetical protein EFD55_21720 [Rhizobium pisi]|uniref:Xylulose 5-phosphate/Fructose 6-phosphate phosphoketolase N-terminal domain-containing protein n=1 Tax=Rhizobium pisi TaxID=574561 RepID=A0A427MGT1_9HYPH|nr:hypothetical protein EFD55_21720 [Rhizobium pisi]